MIQIDDKTVIVGVDLVSVCENKELCVRKWMQGNEG